MENVQRILDVGGPAGLYKADEYVSANETVVRFGVKPLNQYVPETADRATAPDHDDKTRVTFMLFGDGNGKMGPEFAILKCSAKGVQTYQRRGSFRI